MRLILGSIIFSFFTLGSCKKDSSVLYENVDGTLVGGFGCTSWLIKINDSTLVEPLNLNAFTVTLKTEQPVIFSYKEKLQASICMTGKTIELKSIKDK